MTRKRAVVTARPSDMVSARLKFLFEVAGYHPKPCYALDSERTVAKELTRLGLLYDVDEKEAGCFVLSPEGERMLFLLDRQLEGAVTTKPSGCFECGNDFVEGICVLTETERRGPTE